MATGSTFGVLLAGDTKGLNPAERTMAEVLKAAGYATGIFGKWHLGDQPEFLPTRQGFDEFFGIPYSHDIHPTHPQQQHFHFPPLPLLEGEKVIELDPDADYLTQRFTDRAVAFLEAHRDRPFFLYVPYSMPHRPVHASPPFTKDVALSLQAALQQADPSVDCPRRDELYPQAIAEIDAGVDRIVRTLRRLQLDRDTLVVFTSDNGPGPSTATAGPLRGRKGSTWEGGLREPTVAWWPGHIPAGMVSDQVLTTMDLLPTLARLAGAALPVDRIMDGKDIWPVLSGRPGASSPHEFFFYHRGNTLDAVRSGRWKCFRSGQLYDLETDLGEKEDVADAHPEIVARLDQAMDAFEADIQKNARPAGRVDKARPLGLER